MFAVLCPILNPRSSYMTSLFLSIVCMRVGSSSFRASVAFFVGTQRLNMPPKAKALYCDGGADKSKRVRCQVGRRETDQAKIDRFLHAFIITKLPVITIETKRVDGDLIDTFLKKKLCEGKTRPLGQKIANEIIELYGGKPDLFEGIDLPMDGKVNARLVEELETATHSNNSTRDSGGFVDYLHYSEKMSVKEFVGGVQTIYASKRISRASKDTCFQAVLKHCDLHNIFDDPAYKTVLAAASSVFDGCLNTHWARMSSRGQPWTTWLERNRNIAVEILFKSDIDLVFANFGNLRNASKSIRRLHMCGLLGESLFREPRDQLAGIVASVSATALLDVVKEATFSQASIQQYKEASGCTINKLRKFKVTEKRFVKISVCGMQGDTIVTDPGFEGDLHLQVALREAALGRVNGIKVLKHEKLLMQHVDATSTCLVPPHLISGIQDFRDMFAKDIENKKANTCETILGVLLAGWDDYKACDRWVLIERAILESSTATLETMVRKQVLQVLPSEESTEKLLPENVALEVINVRHGDVCKMASESMQNQVHLIVGSLELMRAGAAPSSDLLNGSEFLVTCYNRFQHFFKFNEDAVDDEPAKGLSGMQAISAAFGSMQVRMALINDEIAPTIDDLETFQAFSWMLSVKEVTTLTDWVRTLLARQYKQKKHWACTDEDIDVALKEATPKKAKILPVASSSGASASSNSASCTLNKASILEYFKPRKACLKK